MFDRPSSMLTGKDVVSHSSSVVLTNILFFLLFWSLEIYAFPLCYTHMRGDNDFGSRVAGESCGRPWLAMGAEWAWEVQLKVSRRCNRGNAATFHAIGSQSSPCGFGLEEEGLSWRSAYEDQAAKTAWKRKNRSCSDALVCSSGDSLRGISQVLLKATLISGSRLGCFTYG